LGKAKAEVRNTSLLRHNTTSLALIFMKNYKDVLRVFTPG